MILFAITSVNDLMTEQVIKAREPLVVTPSVHVRDFFSTLGANAMALIQEKGVSTRERDRAFKELAMPGVLEGVYLGNYDLPVHEVISLDRLKFFYDPYGRDIANFLACLDWDTAYVSFDIGHSLPLTVMMLAEDRGAKCIAVKTEPIRTIENRDLLNVFTFDEYIVDTEEDREFLGGANVRVVSTTEPEATGWKRVESSEKKRQDLKRGLKLEGQEIVGLFFDKRDEYQCRKWLNDNIPQHQNIFVFPVDKRSHELVNHVLRSYLPYIQIFPSLDMTAACDTLISFRYDEHYCHEQSVTIYDRYANVLSGSPASRRKVNSSS